MFLCANPMCAGSQEFSRNVSNIDVWHVVAGHVCVPLCKDFEACYMVVNGKRNDCHLFLKTETVVLQNDVPPKLSGTVIIFL